MTPQPAQPSTAPARDDPWRLAAALVFLGLVAAIDAKTGGRVFLTSLFVIAPLALAIFDSPRRVLMVAILAVGFGLASGVWDHSFLTLDHVVRMTVISVGAALGVIAARARADAELARRDAEAARARSGQLVDELRVTRERLDHTLGSLAAAVTVHDDEGKTVYANKAAADLLGLDSVEQVLAAEPGELARRFDIRHEDGTPVQTDELPGRKLVQGEEPEPLLTRSVVRETGREYWLLTKATMARDRDGSALAVNVIEDVTEAKDAELRDRFLNRAGEILASSLDYERTLQSVAELAVPRLADWCGVEMLEEDGTTRQVASAHVNPEKVDFAKRLRELYPPDPNDRGGVSAVLRTGQPELYPSMSEEILEQGARDAEHLELIRQLTVRSVMIVPMRVRDRVIGAMTFVAAETVGAYDENDLAFAAGVARRAAVAADNARLYTERTQIAHTLQQSLLPSRLPTVEGWRSAAFYRSGDRATDVGGDFYDLFSVPDGLMVVLGDVTGKGVVAAALTSFARHTAKTAAGLGMPPNLILRLLDEALLEERELSLLTAVCAHFTEADGRVSVTLASGGHPLPVLLRNGAAPARLGRSGTILGAPVDSAWPEVTEELQPGDALLFYTDGVTDTPGEDGRFGEDRLLELLDGTPHDPEALVAAIDAALREFQAGDIADDTALLVVQWTGTSEAAEPQLDPAASAGARR